MLLDTDSERLIRRFPGIDRLTHGWLKETQRNESKSDKEDDCRNSSFHQLTIRRITYRGFIRNACTRLGKINREALRIKPCWTEPLVTRANLASSMGIVKWKALETKVVAEPQAA